MLVLAHYQEFKPSDYFKTLCNCDDNTDNRTEIVLRWEKVAFNLKILHRGVLMRMNVLSTIQAYKSVI